MLNLENSTLHLVSKNINVTQQGNVFGKLYTNAIGTTQKIYAYEKSNPNDKNEYLLSLKDDDQHIEVKLTHDTDTLYNLNYNDNTNFMCEYKWKQYLLSINQYIRTVKENHVKKKFKDVHISFEENDSIKVNLNIIGENHIKGYYIEKDDDENEIKIIFDFENKKTIGKNIINIKLRNGKEYWVLFFIPLNNPSDIYFYSYHYKNKLLSESDIKTKSLIDEFIDGYKDNIFEIKV